MAWNYSASRQKWFKIAQQSAWKVNSRLRKGQEPSEFANKREFIAIKIREMKRKEADLAKRIAAEEKAGKPTSQLKSRLRDLKDSEAAAKDRIKAISEANKKTSKKKK